MLTALLALSGHGLAQQTQEPGLRLGITTGLVANDNRGLDDPSLGSTYEAFTRFDFGVTFATPIQQLDISGDITLRALNGAEDGFISDGLVDPNLRLRYAREARDARLSVDVFARETETSTLVLEFDGIDLAQVNDDATRLRYGFSTELELRRRAPFGVTLSTGYTALRYSDTTSTTLTDQDRYRLGARFRFDIAPSVQGILNAQFSTFEDDGTAEGRRDTFSLTGRLTQELRNGSAGIRSNATRTEDGERYSLSLVRRVELPLWEIDSSLGVAQGSSGDTFPIGTLEVSHSLPAATLSASLSRSVRSGINDNEQLANAIQFNYLQQLNDLSRFSLAASYRENDPTGAGGTSSLGSIGLNYQRDLAPGWQMNVGIDHRISRSAAGIRARDNRLSVSLRRDLTARN